MTNNDGIEHNKVYSGFRSTMDMAMGTIYIFFGALVIYGKYFGKVQLQAGWAFFFGALMAAYGVFRLYRGLKASFRKRQ